VDAAHHNGDRQAYVGVLLANRRCAATRRAETPFRFRTDITSVAPWRGLSDSGSDEDGTGPQRDCCLYGGSSSLSFGVIRERQCRFGQGR
jgi:hypothetical protein